MLSFLVDEELVEQQFYGAGCVILSSASSKTAFGLAHLLHSQRAGIHVIGLTSPANAAFVASLGCYHQVVTYDGIETLPNDTAAAFIDFAGSGDLLRRIHRHFGDKLVHSARIGLTHQHATDEVTDLPGAAPTWFFAPDEIRRRAKEWGPGGIDQRFGAAWTGFIPALERGLDVVEGHGQPAIERLYRDTLAGRVSPHHGHMLSPGEPG